MKNNSRRLFNSWLILFVGMLAACVDGDGGTSASASPPALTLTPTPTATTAWIPTVADTWQWQLLGVVNTKYEVAMYDIDLFVTPQDTINLLKSQGKRVVCYFSAGSYENFRPDSNRFVAAEIGNQLAPPFSDERWLDTRSVNVRNIIKSRLDLAVAKGCDGVDPDNVDGYTNMPGFSLSATTQIDYNVFLATEAKARGLKVGLKNDTDQLAQLEPYFDFAVNEQCHAFNECSGYSVFTSKDKPVFNAEYKNDYVVNASNRAAMCDQARTSKLRTLVLPIKLDDSLRFSCD